MKKKFQPVLLCLMSIIFCSCGTGKGEASTTKRKKDTSVHLTSNYIHTRDTILKFDFKSITEDLLMGKIEQRTDSRFIKVPIGTAIRDEIYVLQDTYDSFKLMAEVAKQENVKLIIVSGTRNFYEQKRIWDKKWNGQTLVEGKNLSKEISDKGERALLILKYSSMPGTSRHHWGTDIDINSVEPKYFESGQGLKEYEWLKNNAAKFGFCQTYTPKGNERMTGYELEQWHWTFCPISKTLTNAYKEQINYQDFNGFQGSESANSIKVIENHVLGINKDCM